MVGLLEKLYRGSVLSAESRTKILQYMSEQTPGDGTLIGASLPLGATMFNKRGMLFSPIVVVGDTAIVKLSTGEVYYLYICGHLDNNNRSTTYEDLVAGLENFVAYFWKQ
jgi:beta-lactamase class A